jgi:hypothetical protein
LKLLVIQQDAYGACPSIEMLDSDINARIDDVYSPNPVAINLPFDFINQKHA